MDFLLKHKLMAVVALIMIVGASWFFLGGSSEPEAVLTAEVPTTPPEAQKLIQSLAILSTVTLDGAIFSSPSWKALIDFSQPIIAEPVGRVNPFAPISASEIASGTALPAQSTPTGRR